MENLFGVFAELTGQTADEVALELADATEKETSKYLQNYVRQKVDEAKKLGRDEGFKRATSEILTREERRLKEKYGVSDYADFDDLISKINLAGKDNGAEDPAVIRNSSTYKKDLQTLRDREADLGGKYTGLMAEIEAKEMRRKLENYGLGKLKELGYNVPEGKKKLVASFFSDLTNIADWEASGDEMTPLTKGSKDRLQDDTLRTLSAKDLIKSVAPDYFDLKVAADGKQGVGGKTIPTGGQNKFGIKDVDDFTEKLMSMTDVNEILELEAEWSAMQKE